MKKSRYYFNINVEITDKAKPDIKIDFSDINKMTTDELLNFIKNVSGMLWMLNNSKMLEEISKSLTAEFIKRNSPGTGEALIMTYNMLESQMNPKSTVLIKPSKMFNVRSDE